MDKKISIQTTLTEVEDSILVVIDMQDCFFKKYKPEASKSIIEKAIWLIKLAQYLDVPIVAMAEDIEHSGTLSQSINDALPEELKVHNKQVFGLGGHPEIVNDIDAKKRGTAVLIGVETEVCVAHSALHLLERGYKVIVINDAVTTTTKADHEIGLDRMRNAGAAVTSTKGIYYEWMRSVQSVVSSTEKAPEIEHQAPMML